MKQEGKEKKKNKLVELKPRLPHAREINKKTTTRTANQFARY